MNKKYLRSLTHYILIVYDIDGEIKKLNDKRANPKIATAAIKLSNTRVVTDEL